MSQIFLSIINMSISASYTVLAVLLLRLLVKRAPKWISVLLWGIVAFRLVCPFYIESILSLIPSSKVVSPNIMTDKTPTINTGIPITNSALNLFISESFAPNPGDSITPLQLWIPVLTAIWGVGMITLLVYAIISYVKVKRKIGTAVLLRDNIYQSENAVSPFVLGLINPKIYLPFNMNEKDIKHVVAHELAHIRRKDHIWKLLGFLLLALHWFNPLVWLGYIMLCRDIELACDEGVIRGLDREARADYSETLLTCSARGGIISACPVAFGEVGIKARVRAALNYKRPALWIIITALLACVAAALCFLTNPPSDPISQLEDAHPEYFNLDSSRGLDVYVWQMAEDSYSFGLLPHSEEGRDWLSYELLDLRGIRSEEMKAVLSTYNIDENEIYIIPWQNPLSSYLGRWQTIYDGEDFDEKIREYVEYIRDMLDIGES